MLCCVCNFKINSHNTIYKGFDMNFCSNTCRTKIYNKIIIHDSSIKKYNEWINIYQENIYQENIYQENIYQENIDENKKVKKTFSIKDLSSLSSIKIENNENIIKNNDTDIYNNIKLRNLFSSNNSFQYSYDFNNNINENMFDNSILIFNNNLENNLENNLITKYIIYPIILFCKYIYK